MLLQYRDFQQRKALSPLGGSAGPQGAGQYGLG